MNGAMRAVTAGVLGLAMLLSASVAASWSGSHATNGGGCGTRGPAHADPGDGNFRLSFTGVARDGTQNYGRRFQAGRLSDLLLVVVARHTTGVHTQRLAVFGPDGALYQRFRAPVSGGGRIATRLPISGTWITQYAMYGRWCVELSLDDEPHPIARSWFFLEPGT